MSEIEAQQKQQSTRTVWRPTLISRANREAQSIRVLLSGLPGGTDSIEEYADQDIQLLITRAIIQT